MNRLTERDWQSRVLDFARLQGWSLRYHTFDSRKSQAGFPDLVLGRPDTGELLFVELKTDVGRLTPAQEAVLSQLSACGAEVDVWRPKDWDDVQLRLRRNGVHHARPQRPAGQQELEAAAGSGGADLRDPGGDRRG